MRPRLDYSGATAPDSHRLPRFVINKRVQIMTSSQELSINLCRRRAIRLARYRRPQSRRLLLGRGVPTSKTMGATKYRSTTNSQIYLCKSLSTGCGRAKPRIVPVCAAIRPTCCSSCTRFRATEKPIFGKMRLFNSALRVAALSRLSVAPLWIILESSWYSSLKDRRARSRWRTDSVSTTVSGSVFQARTRHFGAGATIAQLPSRGFAATISSGSKR